MSMGTPDREMIAPTVPLISFEIFCPGRAAEARRVLIGGYARDFLHDCGLDNSSRRLMSSRTPPRRFMIAGRQVRRLIEGVLCHERYGED
jgi:hypothetical protein